MTKCIVIFDELDRCLELLKNFKEKSIFLTESLLILPPKEKISPIQKNYLNSSSDGFFKAEEIEKIRLLNPKLDRQLRQKNMQKWLMPFGFISGLSFSNMTNLSTFDFLGLNNFTGTIFGGILGMGSGYLGSIASSASINFNRNKELRSIINLNKEGKWLLLLEDKIGYEMPYPLIKESDPKDIIFLEN